MIAIPPPTVPVPASQGASGGPAVPVIDPPPALAALPAGSVVQATVLDRDANGVLLVRSDQGVFSFGSPLTVRPGATLELTVQGGPGQTQVTSSVIDRGPPPVPTSPGAPAPPLTPGSIVEAVLVQSAPATPSVPAGSSSPPAASQALPAAPAGAAGTASPPAAASPAPAPAPAGAPGPTAASQTSPATSVGPATPAAPATPSTPPPASATPPATSAPSPAVAPSPGPSSAPASAPTASAAPSPAPAPAASAPAAPPVTSPPGAGQVPPTPATSPATASQPAAASPAAAPAPSSASPAPATNTAPNPPTTPQVPPAPPASPPAAPPAPATPAAAAPSPPPAASPAPASTPASPAEPAAVSVPAPAASAAPGAPGPASAQPLPTAAAIVLPSAGSGGALPSPAGQAALPGPAGASGGGAPVAPPATGPAAPPPAGTLLGSPLLPGSQAATATLSAIIEQQLATVIARNPGGNAAATTAPTVTAPVPALPSNVGGATAVTLAATAGAGASALASSPLAGLPAGSELLLRVVSVQPATASEPVAPQAPATAGTGVVANAAPGATTATTGTAVTAQPPAVVPSSVGAAATTASASPQTAVGATAAPAGTIQAAPGATAATPATPSLAGTITATVIATSSRGQPILLTGQEVLTLRGASVAPGSTVELAVAGLRPTATIAEQTVGPQSPLPSLPELVAAAQTVGGAAHAALAAAVPQPGPALAGQLLFFLSALQLGGDLRSWIGEPARTTLDRGGRSGPLARLGSELKESAEQSARSASGSEWRAFTMPLSDNGAIQPVRLYVHRREDDGGNGDGEEAGKGRSTRFLVDLDLSRLGRIQLDGLAQPPRFDLILRSDAPLPDAMRGELQGLFASVTTARGLTGAIGFQVAPPIVPAAVQATPARAGILV